MKAVGLRWRPRNSAKQSAKGQNDTPVTVVFRAHTDTVAKVPFLYSPKNYNRPMPSEEEGFTEAIIELCVPSDMNIINSSTAAGAGGGECSGNKNGSKTGSTSPSSWQRHSGMGGRALSPGAAAMSPSLMDVGHRGSASPASEGAGPMGAARSAIFTGDAVSNSDALRRRRQQQQEQQQKHTDSCTSSADVSFFKYDSWVCRAYCFGEKDAIYANGAISVHQSLANKSQFINNIAKGKALARVVPTYDEVRRRFGLSHLELSFENQSVTRADMFLISEALRDRILYEGEEVTLCGFKMKVNEMLRTLQPVAAAESAAGGALQQGDGVKNNNTAASDVDVEHRAVEPSWMSLKASGSQRAPTQLHFTYPSLTLPTPQHPQDGKEESRYRRVQSGLVTKETLVNFRSLSPVHYILIEISKEMWNPTVDGRITLGWVMKNFIREYLVHQVHKHKASPLIHILMVGRLYPKYAINGNVDVLHVMKIPHDYRSTSLVEEVELQCEEFLRRVLQEVKKTLKKETATVSTEAVGETTCTPGEGVPSISQADVADTLTEQNLFVHAKNTCTVETINLVLEECIQGRWDANTGYIISIVSAGKGLYQVTNELSQTTCTRLFSIGIEKINIICMGRPPLHITPLFEYFSEDETLRSQYHLHLGQSNRRFYERPEWVRCLFYHPAVDATSSGLLTFDLLTREEWMQRHRAVPGSKSQFVSGLGLPMAPLGDLLLPVMGTRRKEHALSNLMRGVDADSIVSPMPSSALSAAPEGSGIQIYPTLFRRTSDVRATAQPPPRLTGTHNKHEGIMRGERFGVPGRTSGTTQPDGDVKLSPTPGHCRPLVFASWYCHRGCAVSSQQTFSREYIYDFIIHQSHEHPGDGNTRNLAMEPEANGIVSCGLNILDSDLQSGYVFLRLRIDSSALPEARWSPKILTDVDVWALLMGAFSGEDNRLSEEERKHFVSHFRALDIFCRSFSAILEDGLTLILASHSSKVTFSTPEEIVFTFRQPLIEAPSEVTPFSTTIAHLQIRNSILFAIKPISPYRPTTENEVASSASRNITADVILRRRWQFAYPELPLSGVQKSPWATLCHCKILPLYGTKSPYQRDCFFGVPTHQYAVSIRDSMHLLEYVLQRLHQQYQIVVVGSSPAGIQWPREEPTRNARVELSIGHQIHELKIGEAGQSISVTRILHGGMYSNASVTHVISHSYLLLNYLKPGFDLRTVHLETQIGEKLSFQWESLDSYLRDRHRANISIPRGPDLSLREGKLSVALLPEAFDAPPVSYAEFSAFINHRFSVHFTMTDAAESEEAKVGMTTNFTEALNGSDGFNTRIVTLIHDNPLTLEPYCLMDHKTGRTICLEAPTRNRMLSMEVSIPATYSPNCHCLLEISWLVCITPIIADWVRSFFAGAARFRLRAVPLPCLSPSTKSGFFVVGYTVRAKNEEEKPLFRFRLLSLLTNNTYRYFPDVTVMSRACRLLHFSGLCYVTLQSEGTVLARWFENSMLRTGQPEHQQLLREFTEAVQIVRDEIEAS
ncbi:DNA-directed RNA polymerase III largest subunit, putative [Trypanosoma cruzi marinkellei]|uniref:DNA-directed RNA polymerase III largest subunit, putative n=1 Tax=Trypanosoma cruzi marinkellei TaxID=85056 RepID=K2MLK7_TRYCR|nr:DNA-directed RNA polymerase III largest subunit, putative [Trypanosoma cruzi marinkellei]